MRHQDHRCPNCGGWWNEMRECDQCASHGSLKRLVRHGCGDSWYGFWKRPDRYEAWLAVATSALKTADGYSAANKRNGFEIEDVNVKKLHKLFSWALRRAKKYKPDWMKIYERK